MCGIILEKLVFILVNGILIIISVAGWESRGVWTENCGYLRWGHLRKAIWMLIETLMDCRPSLLWFFF